MGTLERGVGTEEVLVGGGRAKGNVQAVLTDLDMVGTVTVDWKAWDMRGEDLGMTVVLTEVGRMMAVLRGMDIADMGKVDWEAAGTEGRG